MMPLEPWKTNSSDCIRKCGDIQTVKFAPDADAAESRSPEIVDIDGRQIRYLTELLDALDREVRE